MARYVLPVVGAVIGAYFGGPWGAQAGFAIGSYLGGVIDPVYVQGNKIGDNPGQTASEGGARAIVFGQGCIANGVVIARGNRKVVKKKSSGKGGGGGVVNQYVYWTFAIGLGEDLIGKKLTRIWQDETLVYDITVGGQKTAKENNKFEKKFRFYDGSEDQLPDPDLQAFLGDDTPYFRGTAYIVFPHFDLTNTAERIPQFRFDIDGAWQRTELIVDDTAIQANILPDNVLAGYTVTASPSDTILITKQKNKLNLLLDKKFMAWTPWDFNTGHDAVQWTNKVMISADGGPITTYWNFPGQPNVTAAQDQVLGLTITLTGHSSYLIGIKDTPTADNHGGLSLTIQKQTSGGSSAAALPLGSIISEIMQRKGLDPSQFDTSELTDLLVGVVFQSSVSAADAIYACLSPYFADASEYDGKLRFVKRGKPVVRTLTIDDLTEDADTTTRENQIEYPRKLHFFYQSPITGYATTKATSERYSSNVLVSGEASISAPVTYSNPNEPAQIAAKLHKVMWAEAEGDIQWKVPAAPNMDLVAGDPVGLSLRGIVTRARINEIQNDMSVMTLSMRKDRQSAVSSTVTGIPLPTPTPPISTEISETQLAVLDIPAYTDADDSLMYYTGMSGETQVWNGAQLQQSLDAGSTWNQVSDATSNVTMGTLLEAVPAASDAYPDSTNQVKIQLFDPRDELIAYSDAEWLSKNGAFCLENADGSYEIIQYRDLVDNGDGSYTLSMLQRGRLNSGATAHPAGGLFVLLDSQIQRHPAQIGWLETSLYHRGVSYDTSVEDAEVVVTDYHGKSQLEWPVAYFACTYDTKYCRFTNVVPRHRFGTELEPTPSVNFIGYRYVASDGTNSITIDALASNMVIDCSTLGTITSVSVSALNRLTGAGPAVTIVPTSIPYDPATWVVNGGQTGS